MGNTVKSLLNFKEDTSNLTFSLKFGYANDGQREVEEKLNNLFETHIGYPIASF